MALLTPVPADQTDRVLAEILARSGGARRASARQLAAFHDYIAAGRITVSAFAVGDPPRYQATLADLILPGGIAVIMLPDQDTPAQRELVCRWTRDRASDLYYTQAFVEIDARFKAGVLTHSGFERITRMIYMERAISRPIHESDPPDGMDWRAYSPDLEETFVGVLERTYADSQDCPEVTGLRPSSAVLESHRAAGGFDPRRWELLTANGGEPAGCVLTAELKGSDSLELVYMGVCSAYRGRGLGEILLQRAFHHAASCGARRLTLVVDERNSRARRIYGASGLRAFGLRDVYLRRTAH